MWECGLKPEDAAYAIAYVMSLLMWECGLKRWRCRFGAVGSGVTPYVGVWIETTDLSNQRYRRKVTPYVGVWIETRSC